MPCAVEHVPRARVGREDDVRARAVDRGDDRAAAAPAATFASRWIVSTEYVASRASARLVEAARDRHEEPRRVGHHVADDLAAARRRPRSRAACAERSSGQKRSADETVDLDPVPLLGHRRGRSCGGPPRRARRAPRPRLRARRRASCSCRRSTTTQSGRSARRSPRGSASSSPPGRPCAGRAGSAARAGRARRRRPATSPGPSAARCARRPRRSRPSRKASESGADLTNCGPVSDDGEDAHRRATIRGASRAVSSAGRAGDS